MPPIRAAELIPDACKPKRTRTKVVCPLLSSLSLEAPKLTLPCRLATSAARGLALVYRLSSTTRPLTISMLLQEAEMRPPR